MRFESRHILDFCIPVTSDSVAGGTVDRLASENIGIAAEIVFLASLEAEIPLRVVLPHLLVKSVYESKFVKKC